LPSADTVALEDAGWTRVSRTPELWSHRARKIGRAPRALAAEIQRDLDELRKVPARRAA
jgi:hypothetical protein